MCVSHKLTDSAEGQSWPLRGPVLPLASHEGSFGQGQGNPPEQETHPAHTTNSIQAYYALVLSINTLCVYVYECIPGAY